MSAQFAKDQVSYFAPTSMSEASPTVFAPARDGAFGKALRSVRAWLADAVKRQTVLGELQALSEHELADIGLARSDIPRVFDRAFVATRMMPRG